MKLLLSIARYKLPDPQLY